jgi:hypothetical protein
MKELGNLPEHQQGDPVLMKIELMRNPMDLQGKCMIHDDIMYRKNDRTYPYLSVMHPNQLERRD